MDKVREDVVFIVTHAQKFSGANPKMTPEGCEQVRGMRGLLPKNPSEVICGTASRNMDIARELGLKPTRYTVVSGDCGSLDEKQDGTKVIVFADGTEVPYSHELVTTAKDLQDAAVKLVSTVKPMAVICSGRPIMLSLAAAGYEPVDGTGKSGRVYKVTRDNGKIVQIEAVNPNAVGDVGFGKAEI